MNSTEDVLFFDGSPDDEPIEYGGGVVGSDNITMDEPASSVCSEESNADDSISRALEGSCEGCSSIEEPDDLTTSGREAVVGSDGGYDTSSSSKSERTAIDLDDVPPPLNSTASSFSPSTRAISFGCTGDVSFDMLMADVARFNAECRELAARARIEVGDSQPQPVHGNASGGGYTYSTGDAHLDNLLNEAYKTMSEYNAMLDMARAQIGPGRYLGFDDAIQRGGSQGLHDFIQQQLDWMEHASPEEIRQWVHESNMRHEAEMARLHEQELLHEQSELERRFINNQTEEQFNAEKNGYRQVFPDSKYSYGLPRGDPNIFEKDGEYYRLIPGTGGKMEHLTDFP